jgi:hypothetical protein
LHARSDGKKISSFFKYAIYKKVHEKEIHNFCSHSHFLSHTHSLSGAFRVGLIFLHAFHHTDGTRKITRMKKNKTILKIIFLLAILCAIATALFGRVGQNENDDDDDCYYKIVCACRTTYLIKS